MYAEHLTTLADALAAGTLPARDVNFATSLVTQAAGPRGLSAKQWDWVAKLAMLATKKVQPSAVVANMARVYTLFDTAKQHLRFPKVHLTTNTGRTLKLYVSTERSRVPNVVNVVDSTGDEWYGRVYPDGRWEPGNADAAQVNSVAKALEEFAANPEAVAARSGHLSGNCCFCSKKLTDERSTSVGYGKICASKWGLVWG